jgi:hypothetical protein
MMPEVRDENRIRVEITWDKPEDDPYWLNQFSIALALNAYCKNTNFEVLEIPLADTADLAGGVADV